MNEELIKGLTSLIDETIAEIEDLKKSRFAASEIKLAGPGEDGIKGHSADGKLDKEEDDKKDKKDDEDDKDMDKGEGQNRQADPNGGHHQMDKAEDDKKDKKEDDKKDDKKDKKPFESAEKAEGQNRQADPNGGHHQMDKGEGYPVALKKSREESETLMKSYIDSRVAPLEGKLEGILDLVKKIAGQPVPSKAATAKNFAPLLKSDADRPASLSKSQVASKLFDLKKSGTYVDSADITSAELGSGDLQAIVTKYGLQ